MHLGGFHHLTAVTANAAGNRAFYTSTLGLRLVKKTVNQDDVTAYHLFYADGQAAPGSDITFFDWPVAREKRGTRSIVRTGFRVDSVTALEWWQVRFNELGVKHQGIEERDGRPQLDFEDGEGQRLTLAVDSANDGRNPWEKSPVPAEFQIRGLGPVTINVPEIRPTHAVLTQLMNMRHVREYGTGTNGQQATVHVYEMGAMASEAPSRPAARELHVIAAPGMPPARLGAGGVHHVAFRTPTFQEYEQWVGRLQSFGIPSSGPVNRYYFRSLYFREPNGILFEIATDQPGFGVDEPMDALGERLALPPFLEPRRKEIEAGLKPI